MRNDPRAKFTVAAFVVTHGQKLRADETMTRTAITVRFLAQREADRQSQRGSRKEAHRG